MENKFEEKLKRLQEINNLMENKSISLDDALKLYEEGISISKELEKALKDAENKVEQIVEK